MNLDLLARVPLFEGLSQGQLKKLAAVCESERTPRGKYVFREGEAGASMYVIVEGRVRISRQLPGMGEEALAILDPGAAFGEMAVVEEEARSADAIAARLRAEFSEARRTFRPELKLKGPCSAPLSS